MELQKKLVSVQQTGAEMHRLALAFQEDMLPLAHLSIPELFDALRKLPYRNDPDSVEYLQRPYYTLIGQGSGGDCDDKAIAVAAYANLRNILYRFVAVSRTSEGDLHHVFTELFYDNQWHPMDVTYAFNTLENEVDYAKRIYI